MRLKVIRWRSENVYFSFKVGVGDVEKSCSHPQWRSVQVAALLCFDLICTYLVPMFRQNR